MSILTMQSGNWVLAVAFVFCCACGDHCVSNTRETARSPNGTRTAVVDVQNCGAPGGFLTRVGLAQADASRAQQNDPKAFLILDARSPQAPISSDGGGRVDLRWRNDSTLEIAYDSGATVLTKQMKVGSTLAQYRFLERNSRRP